MIHTVLGPVEPDCLGLTLMHEHIIWDYEGTNPGRSVLYSPEEVAEHVLPYLRNLRDAGCQTLVEASTPGAGRDVRVLRLCAEGSGLNIITNTGAWDGGQFRGKLVPGYVHELDADGIAGLWAAEFEQGIEGTGVRPGFLKLALGDEGTLSDLQAKMLRAAARASKKTGLTVQCHVCPPEAAVAAMAVMKEEQLAPARFIWVHADAAQDVEPVLLAARRGAWVELDCLVRAPGFDWYVEALQRLNNEGLLDRVLLSQDAGTYYVGTTPDDDYEFFPYDRLFREFIPYCVRRGISEATLHTILSANPARALNAQASGPSFS